MKYKNGFQVEKYRKQLLLAKKYETLVSTYSAKFPSIVDRNTGYFWDKRFEEQAIENHYMEEDRNEIVSKTVVRGEKILDLGIGRGKVEDILYRKFGNEISIFGSDITLKTLKKLKDKYPFWNFTKQKLSKLSFKSNQFDRVFLLEVLEHINPDETFSILNEVNRVMKTDGEFVISVPVNEGLEEMYPSNPNSHLRVYSEELLKFELNHCGFKVIKTIKLTAFPNLYHIKKIINEILLLRDPNNLIFICRKK